MNAQIPLTPPPGLTPSNSTIGSGAGGAVAVVIISIIHAVGLKVSPELASAITVLAATAAGYLPSSGRR